MRLGAATSRLKSARDRRIVLTLLAGGSSRNKGLALAKFTPHVSRNSGKARETCCLILESVHRGPVGGRVDLSQSDSQFKIRSSRIEEIGYGQQ
jgi:hypothetical protein